MESIAEEIPHTEPEPAAKAEDVPTNTKMKDEEDEDEGEGEGDEEDGETYAIFYNAAGHHTDLVIASSWRRSKTTVQTLKMYVQRSLLSN